VTREALRLYHELLKDEGHRAIHADRFRFWNAPGITLQRYGSDPSRGGRSGPVRHRLDYSERVGDWVFYRLPRADEVGRKWARMQQPDYAPDDAPRGYAAVLAFEDMLGGVKHGRPFHEALDLEILL
jgi:hypothetical protein